MVTLFSTNCPKCKILKKKLLDHNIEFVENNCIEDMQKLDVMTVPMLYVNDTWYDFKNAIEWVNNQ